MPYLSVAKVPLQAQSWYMQDWQSMDAKDWAPGLQATFLVEDALHAQGQASRGKALISVSDKTGLVELAQVRRARLPPFPCVPRRVLATTGGGGGV